MSDPVSCFCPTRRTDPARNRPIRCVDPTRDRPLNLVDPTQNRPIKLVDPAQDRPIKLVDSTRDRPIRRMMKPVHAYCQMTRLEVTYRFFQYWLNSVYLTPPLPYV